MSFLYNYVLNEYFIIFIFLLSIIFLAIGTIKKNKVFNNCGVILILVWCIMCLGKFMYYKKYVELSE